MRIRKAVLMGSVAVLLMGSAVSCSSRLTESVSAKSEVTAQVVGEEGKRAGVLAGSVMQPLLVAGRVVDSNGAALGDADVWLIPSGPTLRAMGHAPKEWWSPDPERSKVDLDTVELSAVPHRRTCADGYFEIAGHDLPLADRSPPTSDGAPYPVLVVSRAEHAVRMVSLLKWAVPHHDLGDIMLDPGVSVIGRALDDAGAPLAGVRVRRLRGSHVALRVPSVGTLYRMPGVWDTMTDTDGTFRIDGLWAGSIVFEFQASDRLRVLVERKEIAAAGTLELGDVVLPEGALIRGRVVNEAGEAVVGSELLVADREICGMPAFPWIKEYEEGADTIHDEIGQVRTESRRGPVFSDGEGSFRIGGLDEGSFTLYVVARGFEPTKVGNVVPGSHGMSIRMRREAMLILEFLHDGSGALPLASHVEAWRLGELPGQGGPPGLPEVSLPVLVGKAAAAVCPSEPFPPGRVLVPGVGPIGTRIVVRTEGGKVTSAVAPGVPVSQQSLLVLPLPGG